ncbi:MAG: short-chain dehydrogenase/reductase [Solirubrobacterales bacterium]|nr:short-chain dehydrogenase/reductase [Solirubrobacterales bacterium]
MPSYELRDKVVLITGAARGIGAETARQLVAKGAKVALVGLEPELLEQRVAELGADSAVWFEADVCDLDAQRRAAEATAERFGGIDVAIANAGIAAATPLIDGDVDVFDTIVRVNLGGVYRTLQATLPYVTARSGYVLPVASLAAAIHSPMMGAYAATKAGTEALANALRPEVAHTGTKVGCAYFGFIKTDMVQRGFESEAGRQAARRMGPVGPNHAIPVSRAGKVIVRGIEERKRQVYAPGWVKAMLMGRTLIQPLSERQAVRQGVAEVLAQARTEPAVLTTEQPET